MSILFHILNEHIISSSRDRTMFTFVYEYFTTRSDGSNAHVESLRQFVKECLDFNVKMHLADGCVSMSVDMASA
uniref:Uncharacterized protein n=1 Tax=Romanomermis culicivorax TaxID=13658 RepID=A0A915L3E0_ROMCU